MMVKENNRQNGSYFNLPNEERLAVDLEKKEKLEKKAAAEKVIKKVKEKYKK